MFATVKILAVLMCVAYQCEAMGGKGGNKYRGYLSGLESVPGMDHSISLIK
jgi:hypothetical protein